ncbi:MAG: Acetylornithine aminotransferase [Phycisphaerae bacterium]|nr:Acetylornithine aminotransferase [Phycisphaerae bacterium]
MGATGMQRAATTTTGRAMHAALEFLDSHAPADLLTRVGQTIEELPAVATIDKRLLQRASGGDAGGPTDDLLTGRGLFYITEQRRLCLDCTAGHYQMTWGYNHPRLAAIVRDAADAGIVWDNHSNIPQWPVKKLAHRLVESANDPGQSDPLDAVLLSCCTGSVACAAALKMQLLHFEATHETAVTPAIVVLDGNYHGTDMVAQRLRGMWPRYIANLDVVAVQPNDADELRRAFAAHAGRVAAFWAEPVMMNREAIAVEADYLKLARGLCDQAGAVLCLDEIQTGFWDPRLFQFRSLGVAPDMVVVGKGMTGGFHPQAAVLYKRRYDRLAQYDAISTNGSAALPCLVALEVTDMAAESSAATAAAGARISGGMADLARRFDGRLAGPRGRGHLAGIKFASRDDALAVHRRLVDGGLWVRAHAYHEGHSTILSKLGLLADERVIEFVIERFNRVLGQEH